MAPITTRMFEHPQSVHGTEVLFGLYAFAFQIYGDFSGYSDIARGLASLMGFELALNFQRPYLARHPADFWRRWHISLSTWLRDYLYIPLGGSRDGTRRTYRNLMITMLLGGLWHGAAWHYVAWGLFHGVLLCLHRAAAPRVARLAFPRAGVVWRSASVIACFHLTCFGWLLFAVKGLRDAPVLLRNLGEPVFHGGLVLVTLLLFAGPLMLMEIMEERTGGAVIVKSWPRPLRLACYASMVAAIILCGAFDRHAFIYFQF
jgi:alginate O-acetyltransferase complex protein AlgI